MASRGSAALAPWGTGRRADSSDRGGDLFTAAAANRQRPAVLEYCTVQYLDPLEVLQESFLPRLVEDVPLLRCALSMVMHVPHLNTDATTSSARPGNCVYLLCRGRKVFRAFATVRRLSQQCLSDFRR